MFGNASKLLGTVWTHTKQIWKQCAVDPIFDDQSNVQPAQRPNILRGDSFVRARLELEKQRQINDMQSSAANGAGKLASVKIKDANSL